MTVPTSTAKSGPYAGAGTTGPFTVGFRFLENSHLQVIRTSLIGVDSILALTTDYSVSGAGGASGSVTLVAALSVGEKLTIIRNVPFTQDADYVQNDAFPAESHERSLDKLTMQTQQLAEAVDRSLTLPATAAAVSTELPAPAANRIIGWNDTATGLQNVSPQSLATVVAYGSASADVFSGTGLQTQFTLSNNPGALNNLDVSISGVTQRPGIDYFWLSGTILTFATAPISGVDNVLVRYLQGLPQGTIDSAASSFLPAGTGAVARSAQDKMLDSVGLEDYATLRDALSVGKRVSIPTSVVNISILVEDSPFVLPFLHLIDAEGPLTLSLASGAHTTTSGNIANVGQNQNITLAGATPVSTTVSSVASVTGSLGNWSVTFNLADAAGIATGDVLKVDGIKPGAPDTGTSAYIAVVGELAVGFNRHGAITTTAGANTFTASGTGLDTSVEVGDLIHVRGQTREVATVTTSGGTVTANWDLSVSAMQWWYYTKPATGTVAVSGTGVIGTGTSFSTQVDVGDLILVDGVMRKVTVVGSNTSLTITHALTVGAGAKFSIVKAGLLHEGSFEVTNVSGNAVTVRNRSRYAKPPVTGIVGGTAVAIKTVLKNTATGGNGLMFQRGGILGSSTDIALQGGGSSSSGIGIALNGSGQAYNQGDGRVTLEGSSAVIEWDRGVFLAAGGLLVATGQHICNNFDTGVECTDGADAYLRDAVISHNNDIGLLVSGGYVRISGANFCGNALQGTRLDVGAGAYGDQPKAWGNGSHGFMLVNFCGIQFADGVSAANGGNGGNFQNTAGGRVSRTLFAANAQHNLSVTSGKVEATQCWFTGAMTGQSGVVASKSELDVSSTAQTGNAAAGIYALTNARVDALGSYQTKNGTNGLRADDFSEVLATTGFNSGNISADVSQITGGIIASLLNPLGNHAQGSHFRQIITIADDAATSIYVGNNTIMLTLVSASSSTLYGLVRARVGSSASIASVTGVGITVTTGALTGTTGTDGNFTVSTATDGYLYFENRAGASRQITIDIAGSIT